MSAALLGREQAARAHLLANLWGRLISGLLGGGGWSFVLATAGVSGLNFLFHVVISRLLGPSSYGALGALLNLISVLAVPLGAVQLAVTQSVVGSSERTRRSLSSLTAKMTVAGLAAALVFWAVSPLLQRFLELRSMGSLLLLGSWIPLAVVGAVLQGALLGELRFVPVAVATFAGGGLLRLAIGAALVVGGFGLEGAVAATVAGQAITTALLLVVAWRRHLFGTGRAIGISLGDAALSVAALAGYTTFTGVDTLLARHFLAPVAAGDYAAAATAGHIAMFLPSALVMVAFPRLASDGGNGRQSRRTLLEGTGFVAGLAAVAVMILTVAPLPVVRLLFGARYLEATAIIGLLAGASAFLGLIGLFTYFQIARRSLASLSSWAGVGAVSLAVATCRSGGTAIAVVMLVTSSAVLVFIGAASLGAVLRSLSEDEAASATPVALAPVSVDLTLVVPFYNPGSRLAAHVADAVEALRSEKVSFEVIAVSDGSTDGSPAALVELPAVRVIELPANEGKGAALRAGLTEGRGRYLGFIDGDGDIPASQLHGFVEILRSSAPDFVLGSKRHPRSEVVYPLVRRVYSFGYQLLIRVLFGLPVRDTQTGVKLVRRDTLAAVLPKLLEKRFAFDLELLVVARRLGYQHFVELPVRINERFTSTISPSAVFRMLIDTAAIFYRLRVLHYYGPSSPEPARAVRSEPLVAGLPEVAPESCQVAAERDVLPGLAES